MRCKKQLGEFPLDELSEHGNQLDVEIIGERRFKDYAKIFQDLFLDTLRKKGRKKQPWRLKSDHEGRWKIRKCCVIEAKLRDIYEEEVVIC